jgi:hypothetical protein
MSRQMQSASQPESAAGKLFDLRLLIGGLFVVYGVVLIIAGLVAADAAERKASGININLWMGVGMLVLGVLFLLWRRLQPLRPEAGPDPAGLRTSRETVQPRSLQGTGQPRTGRETARPQRRRR